MIRSTASSGTQNDQSSNGVRMSLESTMVLMPSRLVEKGSQTAGRVLV